MKFNMKKLLKMAFIVTELWFVRTINTEQLI